MFHLNKDEFLSEDLKTRSYCDDFKENVPYHYCELITMAIRDSPGEFKYFWYVLSVRVSKILFLKSFINFSNIFISSNVLNLR